MGLQESKYKDSDVKFIKCVSKLEEVLVWYFKVISNIELPMLSFIIFTIVSFLINIAEIILFSSIHLPNIQSFIDKPEYEAIEIIDSKLNDSYFTVVEKGKHKDCGNYSADAESIVNFVNKESYKVVILALGFFYGTCLLSFMIDSINLISLKFNISSNHKIALRGIENFYLPFIRISLCLACYPLSSYQFGECIKGEAQNWLKSGTFALVYCGIMFFNGLLLIIVIEYHPRSYVKWICAFMNYYGWGVSIIYWVFSKFFTTETFDKPYDCFLFDLASGCYFCILIVSFSSPFGLCIVTIALYFFYLDSNLVLALIAISLFRVIFSMIITKCSYPPTANQEIQDTDRQENQNISENNKSNNNRNEMAGYCIEVKEIELIQATTT